MKTINNYLKIMAMSLVVGLFMAACDDDEATIEAPLAFFSFEADETNPLSVTFTNESLRADSYVWDFGDESGTSTDESPAYVYAEPGTYSAVLTVTNEGGTHSATLEITVVSADPVNILVNGTFDDASAWTIISFNTSGSGSLTIADGVASINQEVDATDWGLEGHHGVYQVVELEAGEYTVDFDISYDGIENAWFEVWVGANEPVDGEDYSGDAGATQVVAPANSWNCPVTYDGKAIAAACGDATGVITIETAGTYYLVLRGGGWIMGENGFVFDNIEMLH